MAELIWQRDDAAPWRQVPFMMMLAAVKGFEWLGCRCPAMGRWYSRAFYKNMIASECDLAGLRPGMRVLHVGSGRLPMTAMALAELGYEVLGVDHDPKAVEHSRAFLAKQKRCRSVRIACLEGAAADYASFDAVWISLHVFPKESVIDRALRSLRAGGRVLYRNPQGWLARFYPRVEPESVTNGRRCLRCTKHAIGKETVLLRKDEKTCRN